jgi:hypothetical protein
MFKIYLFYDNFLLHFFYWHNFLLHVNLYIFSRYYTCFHSINKSVLIKENCTWHSGYYPFVVAVCMHLKNFYCMAVGHFDLFTAIYIWEHSVNCFITHSYTNFVVGSYFQSTTVTSLMDYHT